jgi:hypothetical protein
MSSAPGRAQVRLPGTLIAVVPHLLGFHPAKSLVIAALAGPGDRVRVVFRYDLPDPPDPDMTALIADHAATVLGREHISTAAVIGWAIR